MAHPQDAIVYIVDQFGMSQGAQKGQQQ